ncbi:MAG: RNA polymerase sigma-54 factor [Planctomycetota bacterium]|nr:MAG: RNA polymerase sigma-54 factor [Planctomycetota bacterium]
MSQFLSQVPRQLLSQQQRLTPQLIQAMNILQLNAMALESRIAEELDANPALEVVTPEDESPAEPEAPPSDDGADGERALIVDENAREDFARLDTLVSEYDWFDDEDDGYRGTKSRARSLEEGDMKMEAMANTASRPVGLQEYLLQQWALLDLDDETRRLGEAIIAAIGETGRLTASLEEIAAQLDPPPPLTHMKDALAHVQQLDPPGVGARDLRECLLLQLEALPGDTELESRIIEHHLEDLERNRLPQIARSLGVDLEDVKAALQVIRRLNLHPGEEVAERVAPPVVPDVIVEYNEDTDSYDVRLTRANQRELRISKEFREALEKSRDNKETREFIKQKIEAAAAIIDAVRYRRNRLLEVAKAAVEAQRDFLDKGEQHIKVLRMSDLATRFDCDPSTISRTVDGKWIQTPRGIYPLRRFFTGGTEGGNGEALGWDSIKAKVQEIVDSEDKSKPLSDDEIVEKLKQAGIDIKRRTVAKYRAQLGIPTARQRRQY